MPSLMLALIGNHALPRVYGDELQEAIFSELASFNARPHNVTNIGFLSRLQQAYIHSNYLPLIMYLVVCGICPVSFT